MRTESINLPTDSASQDGLTVTLHKGFSNGTSNFTLDVSFTITPGITIIFGPSGAGKTTLLDCVAGLATPDSRRIAICDRIFFDQAHGRNVPVQNRNTGYVFQDLALFPHLTVGKNVEYGLSGPKEEGRKKSAATLESFRIANLRDRKPKDISGGERERVALARALVTDPCVLLLDEPMAALDAATKSKIIDDLRAWMRSTTFRSSVTHNREEVFALGDRVLVLKNGRIIADGTPHVVMTAPRQESMAQLVGFENIFHAEVAAAHEERGTMTCRVADSNVELETPLLRADTGSKLFVGIRAGDILLATVHPIGLSARNVIRGRVISLEQRDVIVIVRVNCGVDVEVHLTLAARDSLELQPGREVWLIVKTHSCHLMTAA